MILSEKCGRRSAFWGRFSVASMRRRFLYLEDASSEIARSIFLPAERASYFAEFMVDGLLRGDIASRYAAYATGRQWGWFSVNDIRALENMNPIDGGDIYLEPMNMTEVGAAKTTGGQQA